MWWNFTRVWLATPDRGGSCSWLPLEDHDPSGVRGGGQFFNSSVWRALSIPLGKRLVVHPVMRRRDDALRRIGILLRFLRLNQNCFETKVDPFSYGAWDWKSGEKEENEPMKCKLWHPGLLATAPDKSCTFHNFLEKDRHMRWSALFFLFLSIFFFFFFFSNVASAESESTCKWSRLWYIVRCTVSKSTWGYLDFWYTMSRRPSDPNPRLHRDHPWDGEWLYLDLFYSAFLLLCLLCFNYTT